MSKPGFIRSFFSIILKSYRFFRSIILNLIFIVIVSAIALSMFGPAPVLVPNGSALLIAPSGVIVEQESYIDPFDNLLNGSLNTSIAQEILLQDILYAIETASSDSSINSLVLQLGALQGAGFSKLQDIGTALVQFKDSGKKVYALSDNYSQSQYYLASYADEIILNPYGGVDLEGFSSYQLYYAQALAKLGVNMHIFRVGEFKSAVEPYERNDMSELAKLANIAWLDNLWELFVADISSQRDLDSGIIANYINNRDQALSTYSGDNAELALQIGLVDSVLDRSDTNDFLMTRIGANFEGESFKSISLAQYLLARGKPSPIQSSNSIALIVASGTIYDGEQRPGNIGGDSLAQLISQARRDDQVKALVLRIDSPGGSAFASEIIRSELVKLKQQGKPFVVSMGSVAASGGYWIASPADEIWASPATITGSIGIFGIYPTFENSFQTLGISTDGVGTTELAGAYSIGRDLPEVASAAQQLTVQNGYDRFLNIVAEGRNMSVEEVDAIAQGRVWSGTAALELGLVDNLGSLEQAITAAANLAQLSTYETRLLSIPLSPSELFLQELSQNIYLKSLLKQEQKSISLGNPFLRFYQRINADMQQILEFNDPQGMYLQCFNCVTN